MSQNIYIQVTAYAVTRFPQVNSLINITLTNPQEK